MYKLVVVARCQRRPTNVTYLSHILWAVLYSITTYTQTQTHVNRPFCPCSSTPTNRMRIAKKFSDLLEKRKGPKAPRAPKSSNSTQPSEPRQTRSKSKAIATTTSESDDKSSNIPSGSSSS